jgi:hypothetical protein
VAPYFFTPHLYRQVSPDFVAVTFFSFSSPDYPSGYLDIPLRYDKIGTTLERSNFLSLIIYSRRILMSMPATVPPPRPQQQPANPQRILSQPVVQPTQIQTRTCEWCQSIIAEKATICPNCHKWKREIVLYNALFLLGLVSAIVSALILAIILISSVPLNKKLITDGADIMGMFKPPTYSWYQITSKKGECTIVTDKSDYWRGAKYITPGPTVYTYTFSVSKFLNSASGFFLLFIMTIFFCSLGVITAFLRKQRLIFH